MSHSHRSGSLRQDNKKHKTGSHQSKRSTKGGLGAGRVELGGSRVAVKVGVKEIAKNRKLNRVNHVNQLRKQKREDLWLEKRLGSDGGPPKVCVWVSLAAAADPTAVQASVLKDCTRSTDPSTSVGMTTASYSKFKQRFTFLTPDRDAQSVLEFAKVADLLLVVLPLQGGKEDCVDEEGEMMLSTLKAMGLPAVVGLMQGLDRLGQQEGKGKRHQVEMRKWGQRFFDTEFAGLAKVVDASNPVQVLRALTTTPARTVHWRSMRSYMLADRAEEVISSSSGNGDDCDDNMGTADNTCTVRLRGYIRGRPLGVNQLIHLRDAGAFRLRQIRAAMEPCPLKLQHRPVFVGSSSGDSVADEGGGGEGMEVLAEADDNKRIDTAMEAGVDDLAGEQTWPTEDELAEATAGPLGGQEGGSGASNANKRRPKGWSGYQAAWLSEGGDGPDGMGEIPEGSEDDGGDSAMILSGDEGEDWEDEDGEEDDGDLLEDDVAGDDIMMRQRAEAAAAAEEDTRFPDEVDTPSDRPARERFARFRALRSFRTSPWDPKESLPRDYARIFQFENFAAMQKEVLLAGRAVERKQNQQLLGAKAGSTAAARSRASSFARSRSSSIASAPGGMGAGSTDSVSSVSEMQVDNGIGDNTINSNVDAGGEGGGGGGQSCWGRKESIAGSVGSLVAAACARVEGHEGFVSSGLYVEIEVEGVPRGLLEIWRKKRAVQRVGRLGEGGGDGDKPFLLFSLLEHEHRLSVLHFNVRRDVRYSDPVPSKERLVFQCGFRKWSGRPVFSQANLNCDKHKYERFLQPDRFTAASVYGPTTFQPAPVLVFKEIPRVVDGGNGGDSVAYHSVLVATGTLLGVDPDRIVLKKIVLTGYPIRVRKRKAVIKYMFNGPEDVRWFKPAELTTKYGLTGHIKEPVGTHGLMKVIFNKAVMQNDTVCLNLYKRVYPKMDEDRVEVL